MLRGFSGVALVEETVNRENVRCQTYQVGSGFGLLKPKLSTDYFQ